MLQVAVVCLILAAVIYAGMAIFSLSCRPTVVNRLFFIIMCICAWWAVTYYQELFAATLECKINWVRLRHLPLPFLSLLWLMLTLELAGVGRTVSRTFWAWLFVIPVVTVLIAWSMPYHTWFRYSHALPEGCPVPSPVIFKRGLWHWVYDLYQLALQSAGVFLLGRVWRRGPRRMRKPVGWLLFSSLFPIIANLIFNSGAIDTGGLNPAPLLLFPAASALAYAVFRYHLLNVSPVARDMLFDLIRDGILVTDSDGRIVDLNPAAAHMLGPPAAALLHQPVGALPEPWRSALGGTRADSSPFPAADGADGPWYECARVPIPSAKGAGGHMCLIQDVTAQMLVHRRRIDQVRQQEEAKRARQWAMLLRDLHDGIGAISANIGMLAEVGLKAADNAAKDAALAQIAELAGEGNIEVRTMMNALDTRALSWPSLCAEIRRFANVILEPRGIRFELTQQGLPACDPELNVGISLFRIVKECVANAAKHARPTLVTADIRCDDQYLQLSVSDDGHWREPASPGRGLRNIRNRVNEFGGTFELVTTPTTLICCRFPLANLVGESKAAPSSQGIIAP